MSIRNLDALFAPATIALIGASNRPRSVGAVLARNLLSAGFMGPVLTVNPHERAICSTLNYRSVSDLPLSPIWQSSRLRRVRSGVDKGTWRAGLSRCGGYHRGLW